MSKLIPLVLLALLATACAAAEAPAPQVAPDADGPQITVYRSES